MSGRQFGAACFLLGLVTLAGNIAALVFAGMYWRLLFLLPPMLALGGFVLVLLPERLTRLGTRSAAAGILMLGALAIGLAIGGVLAYDPVGVLRWLQVL
jgi:hypothetical protein